MMGSDFIFQKLREFQTRKNGLQEVFTMCKGCQDIGLFLVVGNQTSSRISLAITFNNRIIPRFPEICSNKKLVLLHYKKVVPLTNT